MLGILTAVMYALGLRHPGQSFIHVRSTNVSLTGKFLRSMCTAWRIYPVIVITGLSSYAATTIVDYASEKTPNALVSMLLGLIPFTQYSLALKYFATSHFDQFGCDPDASGESFDAIVRRPCRCTMDVVGTTAAILTSTTFIVSSFTYRASEWYRIVPLAFLRLHGYGAMVMNTTAIAYVYWKHVKVIHVYASILAERAWSVENEHQVSLVLRNIVRIKESLAVTSKLIQGVFSSATVIGASATAITIYKAAPGVFHVDVYTSVISFCVLQSVFFCVIWKLSSAKDDIVDVVNSGVFADTFLVRQPFTQSNAQIRSRETGTTLDWYLVRRLLNEEWLAFYVCGMPLHSGAFIKQVFATMTAGLVFAEANGWLRHQEQ